MAAPKVFVWVSAFYSHGEEQLSDRLDEADAFVPPDPATWRRCDVCLLAFLLYSLLFLHILSSWPSCLFWVKHGRLAGTYHQGFEVCVEVEGFDL